VKYRFVESPIGRLLLAGDEEGVRLLLFTRGRSAVKPEPHWEPDGTTLAPVERELSAYFAGKLRRFTATTAPDGTDFQRRVWAALLEIPYGKTVSYGDIARRIGNVQAVRAVGLANGSNPISIIIPCHRVIGSNGSLTGYGGGLPIKQALLELETGQRRLL
jgi:methylated-DNA-[protein]-cysteine S-methyltransferase